MLERLSPSASPLRHARDFAKPFHRPPVRRRGGPPISEEAPSRNNPWTLFSAAGGGCSCAVRCETRTVRLDRRKVALRAELLEVADVSGDRGDLLFGQLFGNRRHDLRIVRFPRVLPALPGPVRQLVDDVAVELAGQAWKLVQAVGVGAMARLTGRNLGVGNAFMEELFPFRDEIFRSAAVGWRVEVFEMRSQGVDHRGAADLG